MEADSSLTQARVRWAVADLLAKVNSGDVTELSVRYDWAGSVTERDQFFAVAKRPMSVKVLALDSSAP